jgi:hypothetical protein
MSSRGEYQTFGVGLLARVFPKVHPRQSQRLQAFAVD